MNVFRVKGEEFEVVITYGILGRHTKKGTLLLPNKELEGIEYEFDCIDDM